MLDKKIPAYEKLVIMLPDKPNAAGGLTAEDLKEWFDAAPEEIRVAFNSLIDELASSIGGAQIGFSATGFLSDNVSAAIVELLSIAQAAQAGTILPGTISKLMLTIGLQAEIDGKTVTDEGVGSIPNTGWVSNTGDYGYKLNLAISGILLTDKVDVFIDNDSLDIAQDAEMSSNVDSYDGGLTLYAKTVPAASMSFNYRRTRNG